MSAGEPKTLSDLPPVITVFPLDGALLLPHGQLPLNIFEPRYLNMIDDAMAGNRLIGIIQTRPGQDRSRPSLAWVGCLGRITSFSETKDGRYLITLTGLCRFRATNEVEAQTPYRQVAVRYDGYENDLMPLNLAADFNREPFLAALKAYLDVHNLEIEWDSAQAAPAEPLVNSLAAALPFSPVERQALLEAEGPTERRAALIALMQINAADRGGRDDDATPPLQ